MKARLRFLLDASVAVYSTTWVVIGAATVLVGGSVFAVLGWALDRPRLATELIVAVVLVTLLKGGYRLYRRRSEQLEAVLGPRSAISIAFRYADPILSVGTRNQQATIPEAHFNLLVPKLPGLVLEPMDGTTGKVATVGSLDIHGEQLLPGVNSLRFAVADQKIPGWGSTMWWHFRIGSVKGELPVKFGLGSDDIRGWIWQKSTVPGQSDSPGKPGSSE